MPPRPTYLIVETHAIAQPLIAALGLKRSDELPKLRCFASEGVLLVESRAQASGGSPTVASAVTASYLLGRAGYDEATRLFYVGSCDVRPGAEAGALLGRVVLVNRVVDAASGRGYYPDILITHELAEAGIETRANGPRSGEGAGLAGIETRSEATGEIAAPLDACPPLVDRELAGFLAAALTFLAPHQVYCLAAVRDARAGAVGGAPAVRTDAREGILEETDGDRTDAGALVGASTGPILRLIEQAGQLLRPAPARGSAAFRRAIEVLAGEMRLTAAQTAQLRSLAEEAAARGRDVEKLLASGRRPVRTKQERNRGFDELKRLFQ